MWGSHFLSKQWGKPKSKAISTQISKIHRNWQHQTPLEMRMQETKSRRPGWSSLYETVKPSRASVLSLNEADLYHLAEGLWIGGNLGSTDSWGTTLKIKIKVSIMNAENTSFLLLFHLPKIGSQCTTAMQKSYWTMQIYSLWGLLSQRVVLLFSEQSNSGVLRNYTHDT